MCMDFFRFYCSPAFYTIIDSLPSSTPPSHDPLCSLAEHIPYFIHSKLDTLSKSNPTISHCDLVTLYVTFLFSSLVQLSLHDLLSGIVSLSPGCDYPLP